MTPANATQAKDGSYRVVKVSRNTGRVLKVYKDGFSRYSAAGAFLAGFLSGGYEPTTNRTRIEIQKEGA